MDDRLKSLYGQVDELNRQLKIVGESERGAEIEKEIRALSMKIMDIEDGLQGQRPNHNFKYKKRW